MNEIQVINAPLTKQAVIAQKRLIQEVMEAVMKDGTHYGVIPGCKQPSLYKAGSEAILSTFRISVDPSVEDLSTPDCYRYRVTLRGVVPSGEIVGAGVGECSTDEEKYRWRGVVCDEEYDATPEDRKRIKWVRGYNNGPAKGLKQVRTNPADLANTVLKMAKKRAQIDLTLTATGASDVFAQDLEDLPEEVREGLNEEHQPSKGKPEVRQPERKATPQQQQSGTITESQKKLIFARLKAANIEPEIFCAHYKIVSITDLPFAEMNTALEAIKNGEIKAGEAKEQALPEVCAECQQPIINGACRNPSCPEGRPADE